jgi:hypothetical protein
MPSAATHFIAGTARELYVLLNLKGYLGILARNAVAYAVENTDRLGETALKNSIIVAAVNRLARWGIQCSCAMEPLVSRMRDEFLLRRTRGNPNKMVPCFTARCSENAWAFKNQEVHSLFGNIAKCIRLWAGERDFGEELAPLQPSRQVRNPNDIGLPELQEVELLAEARDQKDFTAYINALGVSWVVWPEDSLRWKADGNSKYKAVVQTFENIDRINEIAEAKERFDITSMEWEPTATDGSTWAGMWTMFHIAEPQEDLSVEEQVADAFCTYDCSDRAEYRNLVSLGGSFPKKFGTIAISSKDTEQFAMITDMIFRLQENAGPVFTDSETTKIRTSQDISELSARDRCKIGSEHLYNLLEFIQHLLRKKWLESPADVVQVERVRAELEQWKGKNKIPGAVMAPAPNANVIAKINLTLRSPEKMDATINLATLDM